MSLLEKRCGQKHSKTCGTNSEWYLLVLMEVCNCLENLPENSIRDLNDEINRLVRAKGHWDRRIRELGGAIFDAADQNKDVEEDEGDALFIGGGNIYKFH